MISTYTAHGILHIDLRDEAEAAIGRGACRKGWTGLRERRYRYRRGAV